MKSQTETVLLEEMAWVEVGEAIREGKDTVLVSVAATEQHGPHLPIGTDRYMGDAMAIGVAKKLGNALVAPTIRPAISHHHMGFPGSITLRPETLIGIMWDYCESLHRHGFKNIVFLLSHGGNRHTMHVAHTKLLFEWGKANVLFIADPISYVPQEVFPRDAVSGLHAGRRETSIMQFLKPELVRMERAVTSLPPTMNVEQLLAGPLERVSISGILGDPLKSDKRLGEKAFEAICASVASEIKERIATSGGSS